MKRESPFTPRYPVPNDLFVGREDIIRELLRYIRQAASGRQEHIFLVGERGIGKTSLASYLGHVAQIKAGLLPVHINLAGVTTLEELVRNVFEGILNAANQRHWLARVKSLFGEYISQIGLFGVSLSFKPPSDKLTHLVSHFPEALSNTLQKIREQTKGLFIVLDDINGLCRTDEFALWYKGFVEDISFHYSDLAIAVMPVGLPEIRYALVEHQPSLMRVFSIQRVSTLSNEEVERFFQTAFEKVGLRVEPPAMKILVTHSGGLPIVMQEIGDAVFTANKGDLIDEGDVVKGLLAAAETMGQKYLEPRVYQAIQSKRYRSILRQLGSLGPSAHFKRAELQGKLNVEDKKVLHNFLRRMRELGVIAQDRERGRGWYRFTNPLYPLYISMEEIRYRTKRSRKRT